MNKVIFGAALLCGGFFLSGCMSPSMNYTGKTFSATQDVAIITDKSALAGYEKIGRCAISGSYENFTFEQLTEKLRLKAASVGADAIYIKSKLVVKDGEAREDQLMNTTPSDTVLMDDNSASNVELLDENMAEMDTPFTPKDHGAVPIYKRIVQANFYKKK